MKKILIAMMLFCALTAVAQKNVYGFTVKDDVGQSVSLKQYKGQVLLIVNTATRCGFTPQYKEMEALYQKYHSQGFELLDFPCNQFGEQAPGTAKEIRQFCEANFDVHFPQFDKIDVNGPQQEPLFAYLKAKQGFQGFDLNDRLGKLLDEMMEKQDPDFRQKPDIKWNFTKFLVDKKGRVVKRYEPTAPMCEVVADVARLLK